MTAATIAAVSFLWLGWAKGSVQTDPPELLFKADEFPKNWTHYSAENTALGQTWTVVGAGEDAILRCSGKPTGYIRTTREYENFELSLEWRYPADENGNSGILIYTAGKDKIWPTSIQIQLHTPTAGSIFPTGDAKTANVLTKKDLKLPVNTWHTCRIRSEDGKVSLFINNQRIGEVTGCQPKKGFIALQSENSETHFRRIKLTKIKPKKDAKRADTDR